MSNVLCIIDSREKNASRKKHAEDLVTLAALDAIQELASVGQQINEKRTELETLMKQAQRVFNKAIALEAAAYRVRSYHGANQSFAKIAFIQHHRWITGCGLRDSKDHVEYAMTQLGLR